MFGYDGKSQLAFHELSFENMHKRTLRSPQNYRKEKVLHKEAELQNRSLNISATQSKRQLIVDIQMVDNQKEFGSRNVVAEYTSNATKKTLGKQKSNSKLEPDPNSSCNADLIQASSTTKYQRTGEDGDQKPVSTSQEKEHEQRNSKQSLNSNRRTNDLQPEMKFNLINHKEYSSVAEPEQPIQIKSDLSLAQTSD